MADTPRDSQTTLRNSSDPVFRSRAITWMIPMYMVLGGVGAGIYGLQQLYRFVEMPEGYSLVLVASGFLGFIAVILGYAAAYQAVRRNRISGRTVWFGVFGVLSVLLLFLAIQAASSTITAIPDPSSTLFRYVGFFWEGEQNSNTVQRDFLSLFVVAILISLTVFNSTAALVMVLSWTPIPVFDLFDRAPAVSKDSAISEQLTPALNLPPLTVPPELIDSCAKNEGVLYVGAGLSAHAGFPVWLPFLESLISWAVENNVIEQRAGKILAGGLAVNRADVVAETVANAADEQMLNDFLRQTFDSTSREVPRVHRMLKRVGFNAVLTTNYDDLVERAFNIEKDNVFTPEDAQLLLDALHQGEFFVLKLYGTLDRPPVLLSPARYESAVARNNAFADFMKKLLVSRRLFFLGTSLQGLEDYLSGIGHRIGSDRRHFALVGVTGPEWEIGAALLKQRYGIEVIPFDATEGFESLSVFVSELERAVAERRITLKTESAIRARFKASPGESIVRVTLENIGPFDRVTCNLDAQTSILLGDNGVGKSTILKAIGFAVIAHSTESHQFAAQLVKSRKSEGIIELETLAGNIHVTRISIGSDGVTVESQPSTWLESSNRLALGFPPLRFIRPGKVDGPQIVSPRGRPVVADILPIVSNLPDPRVTDLKQWFVNLAWQASQTKEEGPSTRMMQKLGEALNKLLEGVDVHFPTLSQEINESEWSVDGVDFRASTGEGDVPLELLSQGTISVIGWIGILLQRLYEVYGRSENPGSEYALVLMDEVDAHMHPMWQRSLLSNLRELFPAVQFIVTTHSPLVALGRSASEVIRIARSPGTGRLGVQPFSFDTKGLDVNAILTSTLFGLESTIDDDLEDFVLERRKLVSREKLTAKQQARLRELTKKLDQYE